MHQKKQEKRTKIAVLTVVTLGIDPQNSKKAITRAVQYKVEPSGALNQVQYLNEAGLPTQAGVQAATICFVEGLAANIHYAHQAGLRDSAEHLRSAIAQLERAFAKTVEVSHGKF